MQMPDSSILTNLAIQGALQIDNSFEKAYIRLRAKENRLYTDDELNQLPDVPATHIHYQEWLIRKLSAEKLLTYLNTKNRPLRILEIGCGNGWLSFQLATLKNSKVIGQDINFTELQQAARNYSSHKRLRFVYGDLFSGILAEEKFDVIVFAASIQYFESLKKVMTKALSLLLPDGEIHLLDSPFYKSNEIALARQRTASYYQMMGFPEMTHFYFHHGKQDLDGFNKRIMYDPSSIFSYFSRKNRIFPWYIIKQKKN